MDDILALAPIIAGILAWLYGIVQKDKDGKKGQNRPQQSQPKQTTQTYQSSTNDESASVNEGSETRTDLQTYAERQRERYKEAQSQTNVQTREKKSSIHDAIPNHSREEQYQRDEAHPYQREEQVPYERDEQTPYQRNKPRPYKKSSKPTVQLTGVQKLSKKKLAQSFIMAEVLGPPRSQKSYRSK